MHSSSSGSATPGKRKADELLDFAQEDLDDTEHLGLSANAIARPENEMAAESDVDVKGVSLDAPRLVSAEFSRDVYGTDDASWIKECIGVSGSADLESFYRGSISRFRTAWSALVRDDVARCAFVCWEQCIFALVAHVRSVSFILFYFHSEFTDCFSSALLMPW